MTTPTFWGMLRSVAAGAVLWTGMMTVAAAQTPARPNPGNTENHADDHAIRIWQRYDLFAIFPWDLCLERRLAG